jgi:hypothetical protein
MLDFAESLLYIFIKYIVNELPEIQGSKMQLPFLRSPEAFTELLQSDLDLWDDTVPPLIRKFAQIFRLILSKFLRSYSAFLGF